MSDWSLPHICRPFVPELEEALRAAYDSLQSRRWNYRYLGKEYSTTYFSDDGEYIVGNGRKSIEIFKTRSLELFSKVSLPEYMYDLLSFMSSDNDTLYVLDEHHLLSYHLPDGNKIKEELYSEGMLKKCMAKCHLWNPYDNDLYSPDTNRSNPFVNLKWVKEWKKSVGIPEYAFIIDYSPVRNLALLQWHEVISDHRWKYYNIIYNCNTMEAQTVVDEYIDESSFLYNDKQITSGSFSADGKELAISYFNGEGKIIDLDDSSWYPFNNAKREEGLWLNYCGNGQLLKGSYESIVHIYDGTNHSIVDSIPEVHQGLMQMNNDGTICLLGSRIFYKYSSAEKPIDERGFRIVENSYTDTVINGRFTIHCDGETIYFTDRENLIEDWELSEPNVQHTTFCFLKDFDYLLADKIYPQQQSYGTKIRDTEMCYVIINVATGLPVYHFPWVSGDLYYNKESEYIAFQQYGESSLSSKIYFPSFDMLVFHCKKATDGMKLTDYAYRKFYLK